MIPTINQLDKLNDEFEQYGWEINRDEYNTLIFEDTEELLKYFTDDKTPIDFGDDRDVEMWIEKNFLVEVFYSDEQSAYFVAIL